VGTPTLGTLEVGLELPPPQAVTRLAATAIAAVRKNADVIVSSFPSVATRNVAVPTLNCRDENMVRATHCRIQGIFMNGAAPLEATPIY
jgi:hypothetical protein